MKALIILLAMSIAPAVLAQGSSKISCTSEKGITFYSNNGMSEIQLITMNKDGSLMTLNEEVQIENYSWTADNNINIVKWIGSPVVLSETMDNSCNRDFVNTVFKQKVEISRPGKAKMIIDVVCSDELITSSGAEIDECNGEF